MTLHPSNQFSEHALLHGGPVNVHFEDIKAFQNGVIKRLLCGVVSLPVQCRQFMTHARSHTAPQALSGRMLHHGHHSFSSKFRSDAANVGLPFL